jgi:hypothetical protein
MSVQWPESLDDPILLVELWTRFGNNLQTIPIMSIRSRGKQHRLTSMSKDTETFRGWIPATENKKADVAEHPKAFDHVGLLFN